jgi:hypothetical protein
VRNAADPLGGGFVRSFVSIVLVWWDDVHRRVVPDTPVKCVSTPRGQRGHRHHRAAAAYPAAAGQAVGEAQAWTRTVAAVRPWQPRPRGADRGRPPVPSPPAGGAHPARAGSVRPSNAVRLGAAEVAARPPGRGRSP